MNVIARLKDPRYYQIAVLSTLVTYGIVALDFGIRAENALCDPRDGTRPSSSCGLSTCRPATIRPAQRR